MVSDVSERPRYKFKKHPYVSTKDDPTGAFSQLSHRILHVEDVFSFIYCKFDSLGDNDIHKDLSLV